MTPTVPDPAASPVPVLDLVVLDCFDAVALAQFYADLLGWEIEDGCEPDWVTLAPPGGRVSRERPDGRVALAFQRIEDWVAPTWPGGSHPQQFHLDLLVSDLDSGQRRSLALGATLDENQPSVDGSFRVFRDPAGHPFCLVC